MKKLTLVLLVTMLLALGGQSFAHINMCTIDAVPAATLLLPYFEVDLDSTAGVTTLFSVNNASAAPALVHAIIWTQWSAPTIDFDIFLTGFDVVTVNMRDVFNGNIPITADAQSDISCTGIGTPSARCYKGNASPAPNDDVSPHAGIYANNPLWDGSFPNCQNFFPLYGPGVVTGTALSRLVNGCTGQPVPSLGGRCLGPPHGDNVARGYITLDNVNECSLVLDPGDPGYFGDGGTGIVSNDNQLWGDWFLVDIANNFAQGDVLVHIEADDNFDAFSTPTNYTFYGRYTQGLGGIDNREPLGTTWGVRYLNFGVGGGTQLLVWRDSTCDNILPAGAICTVGPDWFPLNETEVVAFNECEDAVELCFFTGGIISPPDDDDPACFPYETGRYDIGIDPLDPPFDFGWLYLNLNLPPDTCTGDTDFPAGGGLLAQSYVVGIYNADGLFSVGLAANQLTSACENLNPTLTDIWSIPFAPQ